MRVCDQIANDVAVLFNERYLGTVPNDASGRSALWGDITHYIKQLEDIRAVENFDPDTVSCEQGDKKKGRAGHRQWPQHHQRYGPALHERDYPVKEEK